MTKNEFENGYCERLNISLEQYRKYQVSLPCVCGEDGCRGWAAIRWSCIEDHLMFSTPMEIRKYYA